MKVTFLMDYVFGEKINFKGINGFSLFNNCMLRYEKSRTHLTFPVERSKGHTQQEWEFKIKKLSKQYKISFR